MNGNVTRAFQLFQLLRQGSLIAISIALAQSGLSDVAIGYYEVLMYVTYLLTFFWVTGAAQALLAYYPQQSEADQSVLVFQAFALFSGLSALLGLALWGFPDAVIGRISHQSGVPYVGWMALFLITNIPATLQEHFYLLQSRTRAIVGYGMATAAAQFSAVVLPLWLGFDLGWSFAALAVVGFFKWIWLVIFVSRYGQVRLSRPLFDGWWQVAWPLMLYALLGTANVAAGPWLVGVFFPDDPAIFGVYRYGARELPLMAALTGAVASSVVPLIARNRPLGLSALLVETRRLSHLLFPLGIALMATSPWWFVWVFSDTFAASVPLFNLFLFLIPVQLLFARSVLVALQDTRRVPWFAVSSLLVQLSLAHWWAPHYGIQGIAAATVSAFLLEKLALLYYLYRRHGIRPQAFTAIGWWVAYTVAMGVVYGCVSVSV